MDYAKLILKITCPACQRRMRLSMIEPAGERDRIVYECECGFEYYQSRNAARERKYSEG
jgi:Zn ribbon nucleic-acid-binding protein